MEYDGVIHQALVRQLEDFNKADETKLPQLIATLANYTPPQAFLIPRLRALITKKETIAIAAAQVLAAWGDPALPSIVEKTGIWEAEKATENSHALLTTSLAQIGYVPALEQSHTIASTNPDPFIQAEAMWAIGNHGYSEYANEIFDSLGNPDNLMFAETCLALAKLKHPSIENLLLEVLHTNKAMIDCSIKCGDFGGQFADKKLWQVIDTALLILKHDIRPTTTTLEETRERWMKISKTTKDETY